MNVTRELKTEIRNRVAQSVANAREQEENRIKAKYKSYFEKMDKLVAEGQKVSEKYQKQITALREKEEVELSTFKNELKKILSEVHDVGKNDKSFYIGLCDYSERPEYSFGLSNSNKISYANTESISTNVILGLQYENAITMKDVNKAISEQIENALKEIV